MALVEKLKGLARNAKKVLMQDQYYIFDTDFINPNGDYYVLGVMPTVGVYGIDVDANFTTIGILGANTEVTARTHRGNVRTIGGLLAINKHKSREHYGNSTTIGLCSASYHDVSAKAERSIHQGDEKALGIFGEVRNGCDCGKEVTRIGKNRVFILKTTLLGAIEQWKGKTQPRLEEPY